MTNILDGLLARIDDPRLKADLAAEIAKLRDTKEFGLVFERHLPETARLLNHPVRRGARVERRREFEGPAGVVQRLKDGEATVRWEDGETTTEPAEDLVVVREFGDPVYPGLRPLDRIDRGGDKPAHVVLNAENYHALEMLQYTHRGAVDVIYIDPPYNTGARDWKYNNRFVDETDRYRHSKWLSFMQRRLVLARKTLKPDGVLIVTVDENEQHHLITLLEQLFPTRALTPIVVQHNPRGVQGDNFSMTHEIAVFATPRGQNVISPRPITEAGDSAPLRNWGGESNRTDAKNCFYPIYVKGGTVVGFGDVLPDDEHPSGPNEELDDGTIAVWPIDKNGNEKKWRYSRQSVEEIKHLLTPKRLKQGPRRGVVDIEKANEARPFRSVWVGSRYDASTHGTQMVGAFTDTSFPFPKSLYSVYDALYAATAHKPNAVILDFFAGSGTTGHATFLLNTHDGGSRTSILVTNNEVAAEEQEKLMADGHFPGSEVYKRRGIARSVTWPRVKSAVRGSREAERLPDTKYLGGDERSWSEGFDETVEFLELEYLDPDTVSRGKAFKAVAPLLWLAAGAQGPRVDSDEPAFAVPDGGRYGVLFSTGRYKEFAAALNERPDVTHAFIITNSSAQFRQAASELPAHVEASMLYEDYLRNFEMHTGGRR